MTKTFLQCALTPAARIGVCVAAIVVAASCGAGKSDKKLAVNGDSAATKASLVIGPDTAGRTLAIAAAAAPYHVDDVAGSPGSISGEVLSATALPSDTMVTPNRDSTGCKPFADETFPRERGARNSRGAKRDTTNVAVGNALVWLVGVTHGPRDSQPRRINLVLDNCHFEPRVMVAPVGATIMVSNRDDMIAKLLFQDHGRTTAPRATISFSDPGQVVPSSIALAKPGLVEVRDEKHSWVRGYIAVAPHPFVAVTEANGDFRFEGVPPGSYQLVVWHERLGARVVPVNVEQGVSTPLTVRY